MPEALEGGENTACPPSCPLDAEDDELTPDSLALLDRELGNCEEPQAILKRREMDARVVARLRAEDFKGENYQKVVNRLSEYGYNTMMKWTGNGEIFRKAREAGRPVPPAKVSLSWMAEDRHGVALDTVLGGLEVFRAYGLVQGRWSPQGGASLDTYFIGAVIRAFRGLPRTLHPALTALPQGPQIGRLTLEHGGEQVHDRPRRHVCTGQDLGRD